MSIEILNKTDLFTLGENDNLESVKTTYLETYNAKTHNLNIKDNNNFQEISIKTSGNLALSYDLILPDTSGNDGDVMIYNNYNKLEWYNLKTKLENNNILKQIATKFTNLNSHFSNDSDIHFLNDYDIIITPVKTETKLVIEYNISYRCSLETGNSINFYIKKTVNGNSSIISSEANYGMLNGGLFTGTYNRSLIIVSDSTTPTTFSFGYSINGNNEYSNILGILGDDDGYNNSIIIKEYGSSLLSDENSIFSKSSDNEGIYYNKGTVHIGKDITGYNSTDISNVSLNVSGNISADNLFVNNDVHISGNLVVEGKQTILNVEKLETDDNIILINGNGNNSQAGIVANINSQEHSIIYKEENHSWNISGNLIVEENITANTITTDNLLISGNTLEQVFDKINNNYYEDLNNSLIIEANNSIMIANLTLVSLNLYLTSLQLFLDLSSADISGVDLSNVGL